jgi:hypothetical protein
MLPAKTADREKMRSPRLSTGLAADAEEVTGCFLLGVGAWEQGDAPARHE